MVYEYTFEQVLNEDPQVIDVNVRQRYVEEIMNSWTNVELLQRINDALSRSEQG
jgi:hypothetical protein